jgi:hypothetical protein
MFKLDRTHPINFACFLFGTLFLYIVFIMLAWDHRYVPWIAALVAIVWEAWKYLWKTFVEEKPSYLDYVVTDLFFKIVPIILAAIFYNFFHIRHPLGF